MNVDLRKRIEDLERRVAALESGNVQQNDSPERLSERMHAIAAVKARREQSGD